MTQSPTKADILSLLRFARQQEERLIERLSAAERDALGTPDRWAAKDYLGNILLWKELQTQKLGALQRGEVLPTWNDEQRVHQINNEGFQRFQHRSFPAVVDEGTRVYAAFLAQVEQFSDQQLNDANYYPQLEGSPLRGETLGNGLWHPCSQMATFYLQSGRREEARELQELLLAAARQAHMPDENLGYVVYNQACFYATNGWPEQALALLSEALRLRPTLVEWSQHDADLDSLRANPAFQAIYADPEIKAPTVVLVSLDELHALADEATAPFIIDVRGSDEYDEGHVQSAVNIPLGQLERQLDSIPRDRPVVTYCNMHHRGESRGERASLLLNQHGIPARTLDGGYPRWREQGLPVESGSQVASMATTESSAASNV